MSMHFRDLAEKVMADGAISVSDIMALRRDCWADGEVSPEEADAIFAINDQVKQASPEWRDFFIEAISEYVVNGMEPRGYVDEGQADWLIARIDHDGQVEGLTELELLAKIFDRAASTPERLRAYALARIEQEVLAHEGPGSPHSGISETEVRLLRRFIFSGGGARSAAVGRTEAEMLFRLKDATLGETNAPGWERLFVQGVGNFLVGFSGHEPLSRERAGELEAFLNDTDSRVGSFFGRMVRSGGSGFREVFGRKPAAVAHDAAVSAARTITRDERLWLDEQFAKDARPDPLEQALLNFIAEETD